MWALCYPSIPSLAWPLGYLTIFPNWFLRDPIYKAFPKDAKGQPRSSDDAWSEISTQQAVYSEAYGYRLRVRIGFRACFSGFMGLGYVFSGFWDWGVVFRVYGFRARYVLGSGSPVTT